MEFSQPAKEYDIVGIGVSTLDVLTIIDNFPSEESVQKAVNSKFQGGGPIATALATAANMGGKVAMIDSLGDDFVGQYILNEFSKYGVVCSQIQVTSNTTSSLASVWIRKRDGKRAIAYHPGSAPVLTESYEDTELIKKANIIHVNGRHIQFCLKACRLARANKVKTSFDGGKGRYRSELIPLIPLIDICIVASDFAYKYSNTTSIENAAQRFLECGCDLVVITDGESGSFIFSKDEHFHQPAFSIENVVDTTGCGDVYHGVFLFSLSRGFTLKQSAKFASAAAAINAQYIGGRGMLATMSEVAAFIQNY